MSKVRRWSRCSRSISILLAGDTTVPRQRRSPARCAALRAVAVLALSAAVSPALAQSAEETNSYVLNSIDNFYMINVIDNGQTVCTLVPGQDCYWHMSDGSHHIEIIRDDGRSIHKDITAPDQYPMDTIRDEQFE